MSEEQKEEMLLCIAWFVFITGFMSL